MTNLDAIFERLGLQHYVEAFVEEGFDTWETVLYITESDLEALNVKLGHRRKLQKEIANARGISIEQVIASGARSTADDVQPTDSDTKSVTAHGEGKGTVSGPSKRKYRRHPKADENAPERPPSAYVIFSNKIREELRPHKLTFTEIAKMVGERWQELRPEQKEQYETQAGALKETYNSELVKYKRTPQYRDYMRYLQDFKARNSPHTAGEKRLKLETEPSNASSGSGTSVSLSKETSNQDHFRKDSFSQSGYSPSSSSVNSPTATIPRFVSTSLEPSHASHPSTPVSVHSRQPVALQNTQPQRALEPLKSQHLPRIMPLEAREAVIPHRMQGLGDTSSSFSTNPRRSGTNSPASLMRHETSKSSNSSNISGGSGTSAAYGTPVTPAEDFRPNRALPIPPSLLTKLPPAGQPLVDLSRPSATSPTAPKQITDYSSSAPTQTSGYPSAFHHLSIAGDNPDEHRSRSHSSHREAFEGDHSVHSMSIHQAFPPPPPPPRADLMPSRGRDPSSQDHTSRMDSLSVLALAGRMMDHQRQDKEVDK